MVLRRVVDELAVLAVIAAAVALASLIGFAITGTDGVGLVLGAGLGAVFWTGIGWVVLRRALPRAIDGAPAPPPGAELSTSTPHALVGGLLYAVVLGVSEAAGFARDDHNPILAGIAVAVAILLTLQWNSLRTVERRDRVEVWRIGRDVFVRPSGGAGGG
jgi:hypothetical protein